MAVGKRIYLKRHMPDPEVMMQFKTSPASNTGEMCIRDRPWAMWSRMSAIP